MGGKKTVEKNREWEKGRRDKLNQSFSELSKLLPDHDPSITLSKMEVLNRAAIYIKTLQQQNQDILKDGKQTFLDDEVDRLQKRVAHLLFKTKLLVDALRNAGVPIPEVKPPKSRNRKKQEAKPPESVENNVAITDISGEERQSMVVPEGSIILSDEAVKLSNTSLTCTSSSLKALEESLKLTDAVNKPPDSFCKSKELVKVSKEPLKEINSTLPSISIPKDIPSVSQAPQPPPISVAVKEQPIITSSIPSVITSINQGQSSAIQNFTFLDRSLVNLGPGTLILADGRVVNVPPPIPQIVVKPQPTLILMQKTVRREKRLYPKPKQVDVTRTTFSNKAPIPTIKHINFEFKTKRSRIKVTKTRISPKQIKKKEQSKSKVVAKTNMLKIDGEIQVQMNETIESIKSTETNLTNSDSDKHGDDAKKVKIYDKACNPESQIPTSTELIQIDKKDALEKTHKGEQLSNDNSKNVDPTCPDATLSVKNKGSISNNELNINDEFNLVTDDNCSRADSFRNDHLKDLDQVIGTAQMVDKVSDDILENIPNSSLISTGEELKSFSPENSINSMDSIVQGCADRNQSFQSELNIHSGENCDKSSNNPNAGKTEFHNENKFGVQNERLTGTSNPINKPGLAICNESSVNTDKDPDDTRHNTKEKNNQNQKSQNVTNCLVTVESRDVSQSKQPNNLFEKSSNLHCTKEVCHQNLGPGGHASAENKEDIHQHSDCSVNCGTQFQALSSVDLGTVQNKPINNKPFLDKTVGCEDRNKSQNNSVKIPTHSDLTNEAGNPYFSQSNVVTANGQQNKDFFSGQRMDNCQVNTFTTQNTVMNDNAYSSQCNNVLPVETYSSQKTQLVKPDYSCKDKRLFDSNNQNLNKDTFNTVPTSSGISNQNLNSQNFVNLNKESFASQNCRLTRAEVYSSNCEMMQETYNNTGKPPCKDMFVNYVNYPMNKSSYPDQSSLTKDAYGNRCEPIKNHFNQTGSMNYQSMYTNQYNSLNQTFINQNNTFPNQCDNFNYVNHDNLNKEAYQCQNQPLNKDMFANQNNSLNKTGYSNQTNILSKDSCVSSNSSSLTKDQYVEQTINHPNRCNTLSKESYSVNKDCYSGANKDSYPKQNSNLNAQLNNNRSVNPQKNIENSQSGSSSKDTNPGQRSKPYEAPKSMTADKACQPEMPLCRNMSNSEFMEVVNQGVMRGSNKSSETSNGQMRSGENRNSIGEMRSAVCSVSNPMYNANQSVTSFNNTSEHNGTVTYDNSAQKRNKDNVFNNKNNNGMVCKYTIDSLFKNRDINVPQVGIGTTQEKAPDNSSSCKTHLSKRNSGPYEIEGLPIVNEPSVNHGQNQMYQNGSTHYSISRAPPNICGNMIDNNLRNEMNLTSSGCNMSQPADIHNPNNCKNNIGSEKNEQSNKMYSNTNNDVSFNKNSDSIMLSSADLMKPKDLDRNNFMPLLDDVRLTTDFSSDLFSSFQVAPGGQHPESMSPTAAFLLAFPLVSTSKTADNMNETDNPEHNSSTPTTILQIGNIDQPNPDMFHAQVDGLRSKSIGESGKEYERYPHYDGNIFENVSVENSKRKSSQNQNFPDQANNCSDKNYRRNCDTRKRSRNQQETPAYSRSNNYPVFPNNSDFNQFSGVDPKADAVPWTMNLNQDFSAQTVQKDVCTSATKPAKNSEKKSSKSDKQNLKNANYSCSQPGSQTVDYYVSKPERKKQKTSNSKTPVNWMAPTEPAKNPFAEPSLTQIDAYQNNKEPDSNLLSSQAQSIYNNIVSSLEVPFDSVCFSDFGSKKTNNYSWSPNKSLIPSLDNHNFVIPSTLPTLVGDLALGTSTPAESYKPFEETRKFEQPKKADKSSSTFLDNNASTQTSASSGSSKKRVDYNPKTQASNNSFLSVSQLVDPKSQKQSKINEIKNMKRNENNSNKDKYQNCQNINSRREQPDQNCIYNNRNEIPSNCWNEKQQKNQYKGNYSAESLIAAQPTSETPESFHLNFNNYQAQGNYFHGDFNENNQLQQGQQYQNYFNQSAAHFPAFLGEEYAQEFASTGSQRKKKTKENSSAYPSTIPSKDSFVPLQKDNNPYLNGLPKDSGNYQAPGLLGQNYRNCIKLGGAQVAQHSNTTSTLTNFNLSTIFPEINDQRVSGGSSQGSHINPNFTSVPLHNYPPH